MPGSDPGSVTGGPPGHLSILLLCYEYPPLGGGGGIGAKKYAEAWAAAGHEVAVVTAGNGDLPEQEIVGGVDVRRVPTFRKQDRATSNLSFMASYLASGALMLMRKRKWLGRRDVVNTHFSVPTGPLGWFAGVLSGRPNVLTIIGGDLYDPSKGSSPHRSALMRMANRFLIKRAARVIAISTDTLRRARELYGVEREIHVINYGFEPRVGAESTMRETREGGPFRLIAVGRLVPRKGFTTLIDALSLLPDDVELLLVGDGPLEAELRAKVAERGLADRVEFAGFLDTDGVDGALRIADCFVLSSLHEGLGIVVQEAMYAGLPIVSTDEGGQVDLVKQGRNGLLVPPGDAHALAQAVLQVYGDPALAARMGGHNQEDLRRLYMDQNSRSYLEVFRECLEPEPETRPPPSRLAGRGR